MAEGRFTIIGTENLPSAAVIFLTGAFFIALLVKRNRH